MENKKPYILTRDQGNLEIPNECRECRDCVCDCDTDCACELASFNGYPNSVLDSNFHQADEYISKLGLLQTNENLYLEKIDQEHIFAFNPNVDTGVIVLNLQAYELLRSFLIPRSSYDVLKSLKDIEVDDALAVIVKFLSVGLVQPVKKDRKNKLSNHTSETLAVWMHVTNACNIRCTYCYLDKTPQKMDLSIGKQAIDAAIRSALAHHYKRIKFKFSGGETTLELPLVLQLHDYAKYVGRINAIEIASIILTNGVSIPSWSIPEIIKRNIRLMISLDGIGKYQDIQRRFLSGKGTFELVASNIQQLMRQGVTPHISITITDRNTDGLVDIISYVLDNDLPFSLNFYRESEYSQSNLELNISNDRLIEAMTSVFSIIQSKLPERSLLGVLMDRADFTHIHNKTCGVGDNYLVIDHAGKVAKCQMEINKSVTNIATPDPLQVLRDDLTGVLNLSVDEKEFCNYCSWKYWCSGGCPVYTYRKTGRYDAPSPYCQIYKSLYPGLLRLEALRLLKYYERIN